MGAARERGRLLRGQQLPAPRAGTPSPQSLETLAVLACSPLLLELTGALRQGGPGGHLRDRLGHRDEALAPQG